MSHGLLLLLLVAAFAPSASANVSPSAQALSKAAQEWVQTQSAEPNAPVRLAPLDARVSVVDCGVGWQFDLPYASRETVRARCEQPQQQLFLRVQPTGPMKALSRSDLNASTTPASNAAGPFQRLVAQTQGQTQGQTQALGQGQARGGQTAATASPPPPAGAVGLVLLRDQPRGARLTPDLVEVLAPDASSPPPANGRPTKELEFMELTRAMRAGEALRGTDLKPAVLVRRGQSVTMKIGTPGQFLVEVRLESLQDGQHGERIRLKNRESGRILTGRVIGDLAVLPD